MDVVAQPMVMFVPAPVLAIVAATADTGKVERLPNFTCLKR